MGGWWQATDADIAAHEVNDMLEAVDTATVSVAGGTLNPGEAVEVYGLRGASEHNGKWGEVLHFIPSKSRYAVCCPDAAGGTLVISVKPANIRPMCGSGSQGVAKPALSVAKPAHSALTKQSSRMSVDDEESISSIPTTKWHDLVPQLSCLDDLCANERIKLCVPNIEQIVSDVRSKVEDLKWEPMPVKLEESEAAAIVAYTHDQNLSTKDGNLYFELNKMLRQRGAQERASLLKIWGTFICYMMRGLKSLPDFEGECWRGYNHGTAAQITGQYKLGRPIQWGAFTSVTTSKAAAKQFALGTKILFKIMVTSGRDIKAWSFFANEGEILLSPNHRFTVSSKPREEADGYTIIDLVQVDGNTFVS
eukprot:COSAG01_NODE_3720_length_5764_cov_13.900618_2_plen_364_part_00